MDNKQAEVDEGTEEMLGHYQDKLTAGLFGTIYDLDDATLDTIMRRFLQFRDHPRVEAEVRWLREKERQRELD